MWISASSLVTVIIPCYNHSHYLATAIESVAKQTYPNIEIVVVDDGSTDQTKQVAQSYEQVRYIYQTNKGLSASRNTGISHSQGEYIIFLDADDWLYTDAVEINLGYLQQQPQAAFVSGAYISVNTREHTEDYIKVEVEANHYCRLLEYNYIGMIAAVMYRRWIFEEFVYDVSLKACEDYDLYLRIARKYPVLHHTHKIAAYHIHSSNMSANLPMMLASALEVLKRQKHQLRTDAEKQTYKKGLAFWKNYYCKELYDNLRSGKFSITKTIFYTLLRYKPKLLIKYLLSIS